MAFGFFDRIKEGLEKTRKSFVKNVESIVIGYAQIDDDFLDDLEAVMLTSDLGPKNDRILDERNSSWCNRRYHQQYW